MTEVTMRGKFNCLDVVGADMVVQCSVPPSHRFSPVLWVSVESLQIIQIPFTVQRHAFDELVTINSMLHSGHSGSLEQPGLFQSCLSDKLRKSGEKGFGKT